MASYEQVVPCTWIPALQEPRFSVLIHPLKFRRPLCDVWVDVFALKIPLNRHVWWQWKRDGLNILTVTKRATSTLSDFRVLFSDFRFLTHFRLPARIFSSVKCIVPYARKLHFGAHSDVGSQNLNRFLNSVSSVSASSFANTSYDTKADLNSYFRLPISIYL